jgi:hypothetical protein
MICDHLRPIEERIQFRGFVESGRGTPWPGNCREWVTYNCDVSLIAALEGIGMPACVKRYEFPDIHSGLETGLVCEEHHDALLSGLLSGPVSSAYLGIESTMSPDGSLETAYLVVGDDRSPTLRYPRIISIATSEVLVDLWNTVWSGTVQFEDGGRLTLTLPRYPDDIRLRIDTGSRTFAFEKSPDLREPLESLGERLEPFRPQPSLPYTPRVQPAGLRQLVFSMFTLTVSLAFVSMALWIIVRRPRGAPIEAAWVGVIFFGVCAASAVNDLRKRKAR